jgi:hypothetical protein
MAQKTLLLLLQQLLLQQLGQAGTLRLLLLVVPLVQVQAQQQQQVVACWGTSWGQVRHLLVLALAVPNLHRHVLRPVGCQQVRLVRVRVWALVSR